MIGVVGFVAGVRRRVRGMMVVAVVGVLSVVGVARAQAQASYVAAGWGLNLSGQLGDAAGWGPQECLWSVGLLLPCSTTPVGVSGLSGVTALAGGEEYSLALLASGTVMAWGDDESGQLGDGATGEEGESEVPVVVSRLSGVTAIAAGGEHSMALLENGTVKAWGGGESGALGNRKKEDSDVPVVAGNGLSGIVAIAAGEEHSLALLRSGYVKAWGYNGSGQVGDGTAANKNRPILVSGLKEVVAIAAGEEHSLALLESGTVMAWGDDTFGELGDDSPGGPENCGTHKKPEACSKVPVSVSGLSGVVAIAAGGDHSLALLKNGTVMAWGDGESGELGDGRSENSDVPVAVSGLTDVVAIAAGEEDSLALLENGTVVAWGSNEFGQLGDGVSNGPESCGSPAQACSMTPVPVSGLSGVKGIAAGADHDLAFGALPAEAMPEFRAAGGARMSGGGGEVRATRALRASLRAMQRRTRRRQRAAAGARRRRRVR